MANYYPPLGFHFKVFIENIKSEYQFQSVSGLQASLETEEIAEGGENRFKHKLPLRTSYSNLVLKRGLNTNKKLYNWCQDAVNGLDISPSPITIQLLNENNEPLSTWNIVNAYPIKWEVSDFNAEESNIVIETLELSYSYFNVL